MQQYLAGAWVDPELCRGCRAGNSHKSLQESQQHHRSHSSLMLGTRAGSRDGRSVNSSSGLSALTAESAPLLLVLPPCPSTCTHMSAHACTCTHTRKSVSVSHPVASNSFTPWAVARQAPLSVGSSRQEYWSGVPFPSPGDLPDPGM